MQDLKFRKITLRKENGGLLEFRPENIKDIVFEKDIITISLYDEWGCHVFDHILKKEDYYYLHWEHFILQLTRIFEIERFKIGD